MSITNIKQFLKFTSMSFISFIIDYVLYSIILLITNNINISNILARLISSIINYNLNKKIVFNYNNKSYKPVYEYILLAIIILTINTIILNIIVNFGMNKFISKIIVEIILFIISFIVQKTIIFKKGIHDEK